MWFIILKDEESVQDRGRKRAAPRGRGRGSTQSKRGKKSDNTPVYRMLMNQDDDDDDDDVTKRFNKPPPRVCIFLSSFSFVIFYQTSVKYWCCSFFFMSDLELVKFVIHPNIFVLIFS